VLIRSLAGFAAAFWMGLAGISSTSVPKDRSLRVMSYNIEYGHEGLDSVVAVIRDVHPDIVGLQEVDVHWSERSNFADQAALLARGTGMQYRFARIYHIPNSDPTKPPREFGVALLSRYPIIAFSNHDITRHSTQDSTAAPAPMPGLLDVTLNINGAKVRVFDVHLDYRSDPAVRIRQVAEMIGYVNADTIPTILTGDLNATPSSQEIQMLSQHLTDASHDSGSASLTYPAKNPAKKIDYVMTTDELCAKNARVPEVFASDHRPVVADIVFGRCKLQWDSVSTRVVAPGVMHKRVVVNKGPWRINVLEVDLRHPGISVHGMKAKDSFVGRETVRSMADRYAGPGKVIGAVNADFFNVKTGESENNVVIEGSLLKGVTVSDSPYDKFNTLHSELGIDWNNHPSIERFGLRGKIVQGDHSVVLDGLNFRPTFKSYVTLYTTAVGDSSPPDTLHQDVAYLPLKLISRKGNTLTFRADGSVKDGSRASVATGGLLVAAGAERDELRAMVRRGGVIHVTTALAPYHGNLRTVVGGWPRIVRDGRSVAEYSDIVEGTAPGFSAHRHPRTAVGISRDNSTLYLMTVDGRRESDGGMTLPELAQVMIDLGSYEAMNFDGGGSTTMVVEGKVVNRPSDAAGERPVGSALLVVSDAFR
jgi:endonuclease/exonuclease/phosphatase family metal-dependent hydrolase